MCVCVPVCVLPQTTLSITYVCDSACVCLCVCCPRPHCHVCLSSRASVCLCVLPQTALSSVVLSQMSVGVLAYSLREPMMRIMTNNQDVMAMTLTVMPVLSICFLGGCEGGVREGPGGGAGCPGSGMH